MVDCITNLVFNRADRFSSFNFMELPTKARHILNLNKQQITNLKIRTKRFNRCKIRQEKGINIK